LNNLAEARMLLPNGKELLSYFTGIANGGYYSRVWADRSVRDALDGMVAQGTLQRVSANFQSDVSALYVAKNNEAELSVGILRSDQQSIGTPGLLLELHISDGRGSNGLLDSAIRILKTIPSVASVYNWVVRQRLEPAYRVGSRFDVDGNGCCDVEDAKQVQDAAMRKDNDPRYDLNGDGVVNIIDIEPATNAALAGNGKCPPDATTVGPAPPTNLTTVAH
jgi:hypothetical protein